MPNPEPSLRPLLSIFLAMLMSLLPPVARAGDGSWTQIDLWPGGGQWATNVERGRWVIGTGAGVEEDGDWWSRVSLLRTWTVGPDAAPWHLRAGVAAKIERIDPWALADHRLARCLPSDPDQCGALRAGLRLSADRWSEHGDWGLFLMADYTSFDQGKLGVVGLTHLPTRLGGQLSVWHEQDGDVTPTLMLSAPLTRRLSVRLGHDFAKDRSFLGVSFSTY